MKIKIILMSFKTDKLLRFEPEKVRGFFASKFEEYILLHQHKKNGEFLYKYPLIQYKTVKNKPILIAIKEGCEIVKNIYDKYSKIKIDENYYEIIEKSIIVKKDNFCVSQKNFYYKFLTPWLALNENNYQNYKILKNIKEKKEFLKKILIGNILSISKSLGYTVEKPIDVKIMRIKEVPVKLKGVQMLGFLGKFSVNFEIPDYFGIGKSVSRGFGTIIKDSSNTSK